MDATMPPSPASDAEVALDIPAEDDNNTELSPEAAFHELCVAAADLKPAHSVWTTLCGFEEEAVEEAYQASLANSRRLCQP